VGLVIKIIKKLALETEYIVLAVEPLQTMNLDIVLMDQKQAMHATPIIVDLILLVNEFITLKYVMNLLFMLMMLLIITVLFL
jgi:hypothetical protein